MFPVVWDCFFSFGNYFFFLRFTPINLVILIKIIYPLVFFFFFLRCTYLISNYGYQHTNIRMQVFFLYSVGDIKNIVLQNKSKLHHDYDLPCVNHLLESYV